MEPQCFWAIPFPDRKLRGFEGAFRCERGLDDLRDGGGALCRRSDLLRCRRLPTRGFFFRCRKAAGQKCHRCCLVAGDEVPFVSH